MQQVTTNKQSCNLTQPKASPTCQKGGIFTSGKESKGLCGNVYEQYGDKQSCNLTQPEEKITLSIKGRFAPSPTGYLHKGSLVAAVGSWLAAKSVGGDWLLRIDDLDKQRCRPEFESDILRTLERFSLYWDGSISRQSEHEEHYQAAFEQLQKLNAVYPCGCSRTEISRLATAPHPGEETPYPGYCRNGLSPDKKARCWRVRTDGQVVRFYDRSHGEIVTKLDASGDFVIKRVEGYFAYQLAVVVDDHLTGVNQVVRGSDLLESTPRQILLHKLLGLEPPKYQHLPLVTAADGSKLSKRDNLISATCGLQKGEESRLISWALGFLGHNLPAELACSPCKEQLDWACSTTKTYCNIII